jgi:hypothetical protein
MAHITDSCGTEIVKNHTCTAGVDWGGSQPASELESYAAAAKKVDSTAALCFVNFDFTLPMAKSGLAFDVGIRVKQYMAYALISDCSASDRQMFLRKISQELNASTSYPDISLAFDDPSCAKSLEPLLALP